MSRSDPGRWYPGERVARRRASHSYGFVLALIVVSFLFTAGGPRSEWGQSVLLLLQSATLVAALWTSGLGRAAVRPSIALAFASIVVAAIQIANGGETLTGMVAVLNGLLVVAIAVIIAVGVFDQQTVNQQSVLGAICVYVLIGMLFTFAYGAVAFLGSGDFFAQGTDGTPSLRLYFSYVTLATLGYGDYTPAGDLGHTLAIVEALLGQLYLVTVVAVIVGRLHSGRPERV